MKILLVDAFPETKLGRDEFHEFYGTFNNIIQESKDDVDGGWREIIVRRLNNLGDITLDWEHSVIAHNAAQLAHNFDKIDVICVCGNMKILPWTPICFDLITLLHMGHLLNKPMLTCGSGAYAAVYSCATQGARFNMVNQPLGDSLEHLKKFPFYYKGTKAHPCGWLDNETGDIYTYAAQTRMWKGVCNSGIYRLANSGAPTPLRHRPIKKKTGVEGRMDRQLPETVDSRDCQVIIRNAHIQHYALRQFTTPAFLAVIMEDWHFNIDGGLPLHTGLEVLADGPHGPIMFEHKNCLHLAVAVNSSFACEPTKCIIREYISHTLRRVAENTTQSMGLFHFLHTVNATGLTDSSKLSKHMAAPLNSLLVRSSLPSGPTRYIADTEKTKAESPEALASTINTSYSPNKKNCGPLKPPGRMTRNPCQSREVRLRRVFKKCYGEDSAAKFCNGVATSATIHIPVAEPSELQDTTTEQRVALEAYRRAVSPPSRPHSQNASRRNLFVDTDPQICDVNREKRCESARESHKNSWSKLEDMNAARPHTSRPVSREEGMRINWETHWEEVRSPPDALPQDPSLKAPKLVLSVQKAVAASYLPIQHPRSATKRPSLSRSDSGQNTLDSHRSKDVRTEVVRPKSSRPYCTKNMFDQIVDEEKTRKEYLGAFRGGYLTPYERERKEYVDNRSRFVAGTFRTHHGKASEIPLRSEGAVRAHGAFPAPIDYHKDNTYTLHGDWAPTTTLYPQHKGERLSETVERTTVVRSSSNRAYVPKKSPRIGVQKMLS